jgi:hypothetical protein
MFLGKNKKVELEKGRILGTKRKEEEEREICS